MLAKDEVINSDPTELGRWFSGSHGMKFRDMIKIIIYRWVFVRPLVPQSPLNPVLTIFWTSERTVSHGSLGVNVVAKLSQEPCNYYEGTGWIGDLALPPRSWRLPWDKGLLMQKAIILRPTKPERSGHMASGLG